MIDSDLTRRITELEAQFGKLRRDMASLSPGRSTTQPSALTPLSSGFRSGLHNILNNGFEWVGPKVNVKPTPSGGIVVDATGVAAKLKSNGGILVGSTGLYVNWVLAPQQVVVSATATQFDKVDAVLANITGLTATVYAGTKYRFICKLWVDADATGGHKYAVAGTADVNSILYQIMSYDNTTKLPVLCSRHTAKGSADGSAGGETAIFTEISGLVDVLHNGTLTIQFAQQAANGTSSILADSHYWIQAMV